MRLARLFRGANVPHYFANEFDKSDDLIATLYDATMLLSVTDN